MFTGDSGCHYRSPGSRYSRSSRSPAGSLPRGRAGPGAASPGSLRTDCFALGRCFLQGTMPPAGGRPSHLMISRGKVLGCLACVALETDYLT